MKKNIHLRVLCWLLLPVGFVLVQESVRAQIRFEPEGGPLPEYYRYHPVRRDRSPEDFHPPGNRAFPVIMLTGYWPPTNEMLRKFSPDPEQNPGGWAGDNWEGRGYNVYAFFPEFPHGLGKGEGDFEVDYQDTSHDWWFYTDLLQPVAIVSYGRAFNNHHWTLEGGARNQHMNDWIDDYEAPFKPDLSLPIAAEPPGLDRYSSLPVHAIMTALEEAFVPVEPRTTVVDNSAFLCNFIGYHACWYHDMHSRNGRAPGNVASGHIHVGFAMSLETAEWAAEVTLRTLIEHVDTLLCAHTGDINRDGELTAQDAQLAFYIALGIYVPSTLEACAADCDASGEVTAADAQAIFLAVLGMGACSDPV